MKTFGWFLFVVAVNMVYICIYSVILAYWLQTEFMFQFVLISVVALILRGFRDMWRDAKEFSQ